jgi:streptogramin lyase
LVTATTGRHALAADLLVSSEETHSVLRYDETGAFVGTFASGNGMNRPEGLAFDDDGRLHVASYGSDIVQRFDGTTAAFLDVVVSNATGGISQPVGLSFGPDGNLYIADRATASILRFDATGTFLGVFAQGGLAAPDALLFGPGNNMVVASRLTHQVMWFDGTTGASKGVVSMGGGLDTPEMMLFDPEGHLLVVSRGTDQILRYDGTTGAFLGVFASGQGLSEPFGMVKGGDGLVYVTNVGTNDVSRFELATGAFVDTFVASGSGGLNGPTFLTRPVSGTAFPADPVWRSAGAAQLTSSPGPPARRRSGCRGTRSGTSPRSRPAARS